VLDGAPIEQEQKWQSYVIPNVARSYVDYTGEVQTIPDQQMEDEIVTQIDLKVEKAHWAKSAANAESGTVVLAVQENSADRVPAWISLFGTRHPIIRKSDKPRVSVPKLLGLGVVVNWYLKYVPGIYQFGGKYKYH
jgi:hypothetical protein